MDERERDMNEVESRVPTTGNVIGADGKLYNLVSLLGGSEPVDDRVFDVSSYSPWLGLLIGADGRVYDIVQLIQSGGGGDLSNYVKKTDYPTEATAGVVKVPFGNASAGLWRDTTGTLKLGKSTTTEIKSGTEDQKALNLSQLGAAAFYGLAKAAGADEKESTLPVGEYTEKAKKAIQQMLGGILLPKVIKNGDLLRAVRDDAGNLFFEAADDYVKNTDFINTGKAGLVSFKDGSGLQLISNYLVVQKASDKAVRMGEESKMPIVPSNQELAVFYGLAKAAGEDESENDLPLGKYTEEAKAAIQKMLGLQDGYVRKTDYATTTTAGVVKTGTAVRVDSNGVLTLGAPTASELRSGSTAQKPLSPVNQHSAVFYGLAKAAGADLKDSGSTVGEYPNEAKQAVRKLLSADASDFSLLSKVTTEENGTTISADFAACKEIYVHVYVPYSEQNAEDKALAVKLNDGGYVIGYVSGLKAQCSNMFNFRIRVLSDDRAVYTLSYATDTSEYGSWYSGVDTMAVEKMIVASVAGGFTRFSFEGEGRSFVLPKGTKLEIYGR